MSPLSSTAPSSISEGLFNCESLSRLVFGASMMDQKEDKAGE
jgi:hypothetical protein